MNHEQIIEAVRQWLERIVIGLDLCPFAKTEFVNNRIRLSVTEAVSQEQLLIDLKTELEILNKAPDIETTLLIHPQVLEEFDDYNQFLNDAERLLRETELEGIYQIASFHPDYQFAGTEPDDAENYTNKAPYPILHLLREESIERAVSEHPDAAQIPERNVALMNKLGQKKMRSLLISCFIKARK